jgi:branched-chain amino acid transport system substrate-binding protein
MAGYDVRRVALIHENSDFGTSTAYAQKKMLKDHGFNVVADVSYNASGLKTIKKEITALLASKPDAVLAVTYLNDSILIVKSLAGMNSKIPFIDTAGGTVSAEFIPLTGESSENILTSAEFSKYTDKGRVLNEHFRSKFGTDMTGDSAYAYQSVIVLKNALERAGSTDRDKIRDVLASLDITTEKEIVIPAARIKFNQDGQNEAAGLFIVQIQKGEYIPVWPEKYAKGQIKIK